MQQFLDEPLSAAERLISLSIASDSDTFSQQLIAEDKIMREPEEVMVQNRCLREVD